MRSELTVVDKILGLITPILNDFCNSNSEFISNKSAEYLAMKIFKIIKDYQVQEDNQ